MLKQIPIDYDYNLLQIIIFTNVIWTSVCSSLQKQNKIK